jgi:molecular chaperone GrpE (heat shock protein)
MLNFETELDKLLSLETGRIPQYGLAEFAALGQQLLADLDKKQTDVSLQIEEIYDLVKEQDTRVLEESLNAEKIRVKQLVFAAIGLSDLLEDFYTYAGQSGSEELKHQAGLLRKNSDGILAGCGIFRLGEKGELLNPQIHTVKASAESPLPREQVTQVLQSGYVYQNALVRKAAVVVSRGQENPAVPADRELETGEAGVAHQDDPKGEQRE